LRATYDSVAEQPDRIVNSRVEQPDRIVNSRVVWLPDCNNETQVRGQTSNGIGMPKYSLKYVLKCFLKCALRRITCGVISPATAS
jgi:hypothetical protein